MPEFLVEYRVTGSMTTVVRFDSREEVITRIEANINDDTWEPDLDEVTDVDYTVTELIAVERDGKRIKTTYVRAGDVVL